MKKVLFFLTFVLCFTLSHVNANKTAGFAFESNDDLGNCPIPTGMAVANQIGTSADLSWTAVAGAQNYLVAVENGQNNPTAFLVNATVTGTNYTVSGLTAGLNYKFKVRTRCIVGGKSNWSAWTNFNSSGGTATCTVPVSLAASNITASGATLSWVSPGAASYTVNVQDGSGNPVDLNVNLNATTNAVDVANLVPGSNYKFKVRSNCLGGSHSAWSANFNFTTLLAAAGSTAERGGGGSTCPIAIGLAAANQTGTSADLSWAAAAGALKYDIAVSNGPNNPNAFLVTASVTGTSYNVTGLMAGLNYKFKVRTRCTDGSKSNWSVQFPFNSASGSGACTVPVNLLASNIGTTTATLGWNVVPGATSYTVNVQNGANNPNAFNITTVFSTNTLDVSGLLAGSNYKFKVRSNCLGTTHSGWATNLNFVTLPPAAARGGWASDDKFSMQIAPNPVNTMATLNLHGIPGTELGLTMFDVAGRSVYATKAQSEDGTLQQTLQLPTLPNGIYFLKAQCGGETLVQKVIVNQQ